MEISVVCDKAALHPKNHPVVQIERYRKLDNGSWTPRRTGPWLQRHGSRGIPLHGNDRWDSRHGLRPEDGQLRRNDNLVCPHCHRVRPQETGHYYSQATLDAALNAACNAGISSLSLSELDAIVRRMAGIDSHDMTE